MKDREQYQQAALSFQRPETITPPPRREDMNPPAPVSRLASGRLENDLWNEYRFEAENRQRLDLPAVSLDEFSDMRDFADGITVYLDIDLPEQLPAYPARTQRAKPDAEA